MMRGRLPNINDESDYHNFLLEIKISDLELLRVFHAKMTSDGAIPVLFKVVTQK